jgi:dihydrofolate reductase
MRKITASLFISLDGVVEAPERWHFPYFNEEMGVAVEATISTADTMLVGRKSYETFAAVWPRREAAGGEDAPTAKKLGDVRKVVVSNQKLGFTWRNSEQLEGDLVEAVTALKNEPGGDIAVSGSVSIVRQLLDAGLLDELHLLVDPIAVRKGMRLFDESDTTIPLTLIKSDTFTNGVLHLVYGPVESAPNGTYRAAVKAMAQAGQQS